MYERNNDRQVKSETFSFHKVGNIKK